MASKIKRGDQVIVCVGKSKGHVGEILKVFPEKQRIIVKGANIVARHVKPSVQHPDGGIVRSESSLHISNVAFWDAEAQKSSRVGFRVEADGRKVRYAKRSGTVIKG